MNFEYQQITTLAALSDAVDTLQDSISRAADGDHAVLENDKGVAIELSLTAQNIDGDWIVKVEVR